MNIIREEILESLQMAEHGIVMKRVDDLISIIEQQEKTMSLFANSFNWNTRDYKGATVYEWGLPSTPMELADEALKAIQGDD